MKSKKNTRQKTKNNLSMDVIFDKKFSALYCLKLVRFLGAWLMSTVARKFFSDDYWHTTVISRQRASPLTTLVWSWLALQVAFEVVLFTAMLLMGHLKNGSSSILIPAFSQPEFMVAYAVDAACTIALAMVLALSISSVIGNRTRFDYVAQGLRGARTTEEIIVNVSGLAFLVPFFLII